MNEDLILSVAQLNAYTQRMLKQDMLLKSVTVRGEVSQFKPYSSSGHWYFTLKDENARIECCMWRANAIRSRVRPAEGMKVLMTGYMDLWPVSGKLQFIVTGIREDGKGDLYARFEQMKAMLYAEGLFDVSRKQLLPILPRKVAVVTSEDGAVYHDIRKVSFHRNPGVPIVLIPVPVQGETAALLIADGIRAAASLPDVDVVIVGRGGGSMEDLWSFNEEVVARAIAACPVPVISAVGHETDFTISDMVADVRASTPSNAAELAVPSREEMKDRIQSVLNRLDMAGKQQLYKSRQQLSQTGKRLISCRPENRIQSVREKERLLNQRLDQALDRILQSGRTACENTSSRIEREMEDQLGQTRKNLENLAVSLRNLSPMRVLQRGYAMVTGPEGVVSSAAAARKMTELNLCFSDGNVVVRPANEGDKNGRESDF